MTILIHTTPTCDNSRYLTKGIWRHECIAWQNQGKTMLGSGEKIYLTEMETVFLFTEASLFTIRIIRIIRFIRFIRILQVQNLNSILTQESYQRYGHICDQGWHTLVRQSSSWNRRGTQGTKKLWILGKALFHLCGFFPALCKVD